MRHVDPNIVISDVVKVLKVDTLRALHRMSMNEFHRIYFGHEFCERLLPDSDQFRCAVDIIRKRNKKLSVMTPSVTECGLDHIRGLVSALNEDDEVVVNDFGVLNMMATEFSNPIVIGRILGRIVIPSLVTARKDAGLFCRYLALLGPGICGLEVDGFNASCIDSFWTESIDIFLYATPIVWTTTKRCAFNSRRESLKKFCMCKRECLKTRAVIENTEAHKKLALKGNAILDLNGDLSALNHNAFFKRIIFE